MRVKPSLLLLLAGIFSLSVFFGQACGLSRPAVVNSTNTASSFSHAPTLTACASCHQSSRPLAAVGRHQFSHIDPAYGGTGDCIDCHTVKNNWGVSWLGGQLAHDPQPSTCVSCHAGDRPTTLVGTPAFNHSLNGKGDCVSCHAANTIRYDAITDWAGGESMPTSLIGNRTISVTTGTPVFTGSSITAVNTSTKVLPLQMQHSTIQVPQVFLDTCTNCHAGAPTGNFNSGNLHDSLGNNSQPQPTSCTECHGNTMPTGFVGLNDIQRTPPSAPMRHEALAWSKNAAGVWTKTTTKIVTQDCATCHTSPGGTWASTNFHAKIGTAPSSCIDCHSNSRPVGAIGTPPFNHATNGGDGDCIACHTVTNFASRAGWANGNFSHTGVTQCASCHETQRPKNTTGWVTAGWSAATTRFDLTKHAVGTDCYTCHSTTTNHNSLADFAGGNFNHSPRPANCLSCHAYPVGPVGSPATDHAGFGGQDCAGCHTTNSTFANLTGWAGTSSTPSGLVNGDNSLFTWTYWTVNPIQIAKSGNIVTTATQQNGIKLPMQMLHSSPAVSNVANCNACHTVGKLASSGTRFHTSIATQPTANCLTCHSPNGIPTGIVGPNSTDTAGVANMNHQALSATECSTCHTNTGKRWSDGVFHSKVAAASLTKCVDCHYAKMPKTTVATSKVFTTSIGQTFPQHLAHTSSAITQDCLTCHAQRGPAAGNTAPWKTGVSKLHSVVAAAGIKTCNECHSADRPSATTFYPSATANKRYVHASNYRGDTDCFTCHTKKATSNYTDLTKIGTTWAGGLYNHQTAAGARLGSSTCSNCHGGSGFYDHENLGKTVWKTSMPCMTCHATAAF